MQAMYILCTFETSFDFFSQVEEHSVKLGEDKDNKKAREGFIEACRVIELMDFKEVEGLAETMFKGEGTREKFNSTFIKTAVNIST